MSLRQQNELTLNDSLCATENVSQEHYQAHTSLKGPLLKPSLTDAAKDFSIEQAVVAFGLKLDSEESGQVSNESGEVGSPKWPIEDIPETKGFVLTPYMSKSFKALLSNADPYLMDVDIEPLMENYSKNFERSSRAVRRTALDFILNECMTVLVSIVVPLWEVFPFTFTPTRKADTSPRKVRQRAAMLNVFLRPGTM